MLEAVVPLPVSRPGAIMTTPAFKLSVFALAAGLSVLFAASPAFAAGKKKYDSNNNTNNNNTNNANKNQKPANNPPAPIDMSGVQSAQTDLNAGREELKKAEQVWAEIARKLQTTFEASSLFKTAVDEQHTAQVASDAASKTVLVRLSSDANYTTAQADKKAADDQVTKLRTDAAAADAVSAASAESLKKATIVSQLQMQAIAADGPASEAKAKALAAAQRLTEMRKQFTDSLKDNPECADAKKGVDDAKAKVATAETALAEAQKNVAQQRRAAAAAR